MVNKDLINDIIEEFYPDYDFGDSNSEVVPFPIKRRRGKPNQVVEGEVVSVNDTVESEARKTPRSLPAVQDNT